MDSFIDRAREIVGMSNVLTQEEAVDYADPYSFDAGFAGSPRGVVKPGSVADVQNLVRAANETSESLWTVSRGRNFGYGGATPAHSDSFILDLSRLDQILEVNVSSGYVVVQPGVSFFQLHAHLTEHQVPLAMSVPDLGGGSLIGNALERGFGYSAHGEHGNYLIGLEIVLPDGELLRTGMGAVEGGESQYVYKGGFGPSVDGLFSQSNLGIVVSAGIWMHPRPDVIAACLISVPAVSDLASLVDLVRPLMLDRTIDSVVIVGNALAIASQIMPRVAVYDGDGPIPEANIESVVQKLGIGSWNAKFGLYGNRGVVDSKLSVIRARVDEHDGWRLQERLYPGDVDSQSVHPADRAQVGVPSGDLIQMAAWRGGEPAHTDFSVVSSTIGSDAQRLVDLLGTIIQNAGFDHAGGFTMFGRHAIMLSLLSFDASDSDERDRVRLLFSDLIAAAGDAGYAPYRSHTAFMDEIADVYNFNDSVLRRTVTRIKDALDPSGVLSPGKQGIWPSRAD